MVIRTTYCNNPLVLREKGAGYCNDILYSAPDFFIYLIIILFLRIWLKGLTSSQRCEHIWYHKLHLSCILVTYLAKWTSVVSQLGGTLAYTRAKRYTLADALHFRVSCTARVSSTCPTDLLARSSSAPERWQAHCPSHQGESWALGSKSSHSLPS